MVDISDGYIELKISKDEIPKATGKQVHKIFV